MYKRRIKYLNRQNVLYRSQYGFRKKKKKHSTNLATIELRPKLCKQEKIVNILNSYQRRTNRRSCSGSLSNSVFERRTSTGSGLFASLGSGLVKTLG